MNKIKSVELNNFRAYKGNKKFDFVTTKGYVADFILIYAPNGVGKTSFFDAIEWGITGKIDRLENDIGDNNYEGYILKNRDSKDEITDVKIILDNDEYVSRKTRRLGERQRKDYTPGIKNGSKDILEYENWESLILPHNRIEGFIKDNSGNKKYEYWGSYWDPTGTERRLFQFIYKMRKCAKAENDKIQEQIKDKSSEFNDSKKIISVIENINAVLKHYNQISQEKINYITVNLTSEEYSRFINLIEANKSKIKSEIIDKSNIQDELKELYNDFVVNLDKKKLILHNYRFLRDSWSKILQIANEKRLYIDKVNIINEKILKNKEKIKSLEDISDSGEKWFKTYERYKKDKDFIAFAVEKRKELDNRLNLLINQNKELKKTYDKTASDNSVEINKTKLIEYVKEIKLIYEKSKRNKRWQNKIDIIISKIEREKKKNEINLNKLKDSIIVNYSDFSITNLFKEGMCINNKEVILGELEVLKLKKSEIETEILVENTKYEAEEKLSEALNNIIKEAREYIVRNHSSICPVCNKEYDSEQILLERTNILNNKEVMKCIKKLNKSKEQLKEINNKIEEVCQNWNKEVLNKIEELKNIITKIKNDIYRANLLKDNLDKEETVNFELIKKYKDESKKLGYFFTKFSLVLVGEWYKNECLKYQEKLKIINLK